MKRLKNRQRDRYHEEVDNTVHVEKDGAQDLADAMMGANPQVSTKRATPSSTHVIELSLRPLGSQCFKLDGRRKPDEFFWQGIADLRWDGKSLPVVVSARTDEEDREGSTKADWEAKLRSAAVGAAKIGALSAFRENDLTHRLPKRPTGKPGAAKVRVSDSFLKRLEEEFAHDQLARKSFRHAVARVRAYGDWPASQGNDASVMLTFLTRCIECCYTEFMYSWYREKISGIRRSMEDLARRKDRSHAGYRQSQEHIKDNIYGFNPPDAWLQRPPVLNLPEYEE